ncbi:Uncharacterised protein [Streptococcus pneumoniae]|nr:Uncharacterised protein [Streptococcus pneumoniae]CEO78794.1 Uncharacterised protein [Streptococcus pneumoniae]CEV63153.1 Uncharacterised protein [Streptococcus pneumoniae]CEV69197.1 Uncharacterised protein [Streptococcus pneumoniae]CEW13714.1 Uncharacterised protein [Streptococcus pneumoniae]
MRFYCEAYEVITEEKKVSFFYVDEKPLRYLLFDYIFLLVLAKKISQSYELHPKS